MAGQLVYQVGFSADFHRGSGRSRPGFADAVLDRGADGLPRLRGSGMKGLARDGARRAVAYLGHPHPDADPLFQRVFGRSAEGPRGSEEGWFNFLSAVLPGGSGLTDFRDQMSARRVHNRIDDRLGRVVQDFFYAREVGSRHLSFVGRVTWDHMPEPDEVTLLALGFRMIEAIGAKRTRGEGECLVRLLGAYNVHWDVANDAPEGLRPGQDEAALLESVASFIDRVSPAPATSQARP